MSTYINCFLFISCQSTSSGTNTSDPVANYLQEQTSQKSHKYLSNVLYLLEQVKNSIIYLQEETNKKKLLCYISRLYEALSHFTNVCFDYKAPGSVNKFANDIEKELVNGCILNQNIIRLIKIRLHVCFSSNAKAQKTLESVLSKVQLKLQRYLVHIDYFNKRMYDFCRVE